VKCLLLFGAVVEFYSKGRGEKGWRNLHKEGTGGLYSW
jgi:hypothetical protein